MKNVEYENNLVKGLYKSLIKEHQCLSSIINTLIQKGDLFIKDIVNDNYHTRVVTFLDKELILFEIDYFKHQIYVTYPNKMYKETYNNIAHKDVEPSEIEYQSDTKVITRKNIFETKYDDSDKYYYNIRVKDNDYVVIIVDQNESYNEKEFIDTILYSNIIINNIRDLFLIVSNYMNSKELNIKIADSMGSIVVIDNGKITQYTEYRDIGDEYEQIYLEDGEFYIKEIVKKVYQDNLTSYIKKLGEYHGKEKR